MTASRRPSAAAPALGGRPEAALSGRAPVGAPTQGQGRPEAVPITLTRWDGHATTPADAHLPMRSPNRPAPAVGHVLRRGVPPSARGGAGAAHQGPRPAFRALRDAGAGHGGCSVTRPDQAHPPVVPRPRALSGLPQDHRPAAPVAAAGARPRDFHPAGSARRIRLQSGPGRLQCPGLRSALRLPAGTRPPNAAAVGRGDTAPAEATLQTRTGSAPEPQRPWRPCRAETATPADTPRREPDRARAHDHGTVARPSPRPFTGARRPPGEMPPGGSRRGVVPGRAKAYCSPYTKSCDVDHGQPREQPPRHRPPARGRPHSER